MPMRPNTRETLKWDAACATDVGHMRKVNEDAYFDGSAEGVWVVADGMGGHVAGELASRLVVDALSDMVWHGALSTFVTELEDRLIDVNQVMLELPGVEEQIIGTTVIALQFGARGCVYSWVGDSRLYRLREGTLTRLTQDHSAVEELVENGVIDRDAAEHHPDANMITRALGVEPSPALDMDYADLRQGDVFLLCSDGLSKGLSNTEIEQALVNSDDAQTAVQQLVAATLRGAASDNITACVVRVTDV